MNYAIKILEHKKEKLQYKLFMLAPTMENNDLILEIEHKCTDIEQAILLIIGEH